MRVNNIQQNTSFKANTIVSFEKQIENMSGHASVFAVLERHIPNGQTGKTFLISEGEKMSELVPDISTESGNTLVTAFYRAYRYFKSVSEDSKQIWDRVYADPEVTKALTDILDSTETVRVPYRDVFRNYPSLDHVK